MPAVRAKLVKWGNSKAIRIPKVVLDQARMKEGDEVEIRVKAGGIALEPLRAKVTLDSLVKRITPENRHQEQDWGKPVGKEIW
jgi:antitoxin MazE